jgi:hypothetical protein
MVALPSGQRESVIEQQATTSRTRSRTSAASARAYAPPVDAPTATNRSIARWSATSSASGIQSAILRPGRSVDRPYPGRSMPMIRRPASRGLPCQVSGLCPAARPAVTPQHSGRWRTAVVGVSRRAPVGEPDRPVLQAVPPHNSGTGPARLACPRHAPSLRPKPTGSAARPQSGADRHCRTASVIRVASNSRSVFR